MDKLSSVKIYQASRNYNPKTQLYQCSVTFKITMTNGRISFVDIPYTLEHERLHYFFCDLIDKNIEIYKLDELGVILGIVQNLGLYVKDLIEIEKGDNNE